MLAQKDLLCQLLVQVFGGIRVNGHRPSGIPTTARRNAALPRCPQAPRLRHPYVPSWVLIPQSVQFVIGDFQVSHWDIPFSVHPPTMTGQRHRSKGCEEHQTTSVPRLKSGVPSSICSSPCRGNTCRLTSMLELEARRSQRKSRCIPSGRTRKNPRRRLHILRTGVPGARKGG